MSALDTAIAEPAVNSLLEHLTLERIGPVEATVGMVSLPLPRALAPTLSQGPSGQRVRIDHPRSALLPVGWWQRHETPRRAIAYMLNDAGAAATLRLTDEPAGAAAASDAWALETRIIREIPRYRRVSYKHLDGLRGVPPEDCIVAEFDLLLTFSGKTLSVRLGATGRDGVEPHLWQSVQIDRLWANAVAQGVRVGGLVYNADTYLWVDLYLVLFANGVADVAAHFVNGKLHIQGFDFHGLPFLRFAGDGVAVDKPWTLTGDAAEGDLSIGSLRLNLSDCAALVSAENPGRIEAQADGVVWRPLARTFNPQVEAQEPFEWPPGFARTVRFQMSLSAARPLIARYRVPAWWYALSGEAPSMPAGPGAPEQGYLPVRGEVDVVSAQAAERIEQRMKRGRFDAGSSEKGNDGYAGTGLLFNYYHTGRPELHRAGVDYCYYWADIAVDHTDFTVHQWVGGWPWKTCAYTKFRDLLFGYLETGDPYLHDTMEMCAAAYWAWFRANWPRHSIGRDSFEIGAWALMWRYFDCPHARERCAEFARMMGVVLDTRGNIGGQMGVGPHPGHLPSLYMTGIGMVSLLEVAEAQSQMTDLDAPSAPPAFPDIPAMLRRLSAHYMRRGVEMFPSDHGRVEDYWRQRVDRLQWTTDACRIYPALARLQGREDEITSAGLQRCFQNMIFHPEVWRRIGRVGNAMINPLYHEATLLGATWTGSGVALAPIGSPRYWAEHVVVETPLGDLEVRTQRGDDGSTTLRFSAATPFAVTVNYGTFAGTTSSTSSLTLPADARPDDSDGVTNLLPYLGKGFGAGFDQAILNVGVGIMDRTQTLSEVRVCPATQALLYETDHYTARRIEYRAGARPVLEAIVARFDAATARERALQAMAWTREHVAHPHHAGAIPADRGLWREEDIIESGVGWCNEQARVFIALCQVMGMPARLCFVYHRNGKCSHAASEVFVDDRWAFFDQTFGVTVALPSGLLAEGRELSGPHRALAHRAYEPALRDYYPKVLPYVEQCPAWNSDTRPTADRGGDLLHQLGICQYATGGVQA